jgi:gamma-polyglutamate biosynthesis protein CapA
MKALLVFIFSLFTTTNLLSPQIKFFSPSPKPSGTPTSVTVGFVGDLGLGRYITSLSRAKNDFSWSFQKISPWLLQNDFTLANLESPIIADCPTDPGSTFTFCGDPRFVPFLHDYRFVLNLNNNHILNYGQNGLSQTESYLGSDYFYDQFYIKKINNISFGFLGYDFISNPDLDQPQILSQIKTVRQQVDFLIVSLHWGNEYLSAPESWRVDFAHQLVDAGVDVVFGQHPHVWQGMEIYHDKYIFYSFGNFIFDQNWSTATTHSQIARLTFTKNKITGYQLFPIAIKFDSQPVLMP